MKLYSFCIKNYRSIVNSNWCTLASDNVTALIGQNESGKTSVLEALYSFYTGAIIEDVLRSDLTLPVVSCKFELEKGNVADLLDIRKIPAELAEKLRSDNTFILTRRWKEDKESELFASSEDIEEYFAKKEEAKLAIETKTQQEIQEWLLKAESVFREMELAEKEKNDAQINLSTSNKVLEDSRKALQKAKKPDARLIAEKDFELAQNDYAKVEKEFKDGVELYEKAKVATQELSEKVTVCNACETSIKELEIAQSEYDSIVNYLKETEHKYETTNSEKEQKNLLSLIQQAESDLQAALRKLNTAKQNSSLQKSIAAKVLNGITFRQAENEAKNELEKENICYSTFDMGTILFQNIPEFEFFEDFSSLLPNKIDLDDILEENTHTEGYKAARNFLQIAGLNAAFFRERNHRILKQKIENLNGEITINFQDYWSQNVGKNSKIQLNFELEHYDYTHPEKSGKPYLEFWIKDKQERLYPKQRSRGVRWFLSFYLELKATVKNIDASRVLLIDEPGLSLHARAQEDVLKVFEDLKDKMQIMYSTHSPHLIDVNKLYRILAVQRADEDDDRSETVVLDAGSLYSASMDTLSPVYSLMGVKINSQSFINPKNNIIVEDTLSYYYLNSLIRIFGSSPSPHFIPSTGMTNIPVLTNILLGWKVEFSIFLFGDSRSAQMVEELKNTVFFTNTSSIEKSIIRVEKFEYPEDVFSTLDFKKFVLQKRVGITEKNSEYIMDTGLSRTVLAAQFINYCEEHNISRDDFDEETKHNVSQILNTIASVLS